MSPRSVIRGRVAIGTVSRATGGPRSAPPRARRVHWGDAVGQWVSRASSPGSHALRDRPAPPPGPAPSNPLRGRGPGESRPRLPAASGEGRVPRPASRGGRGRAGVGPGAGQRAGRLGAGPHWLPRSRPPGLSARWRQRRWCGSLAPRSPAPPGARTHRSVNAAGGGRGRWAAGQRAEQEPHAASGRQRQPGRCAGAEGSRRALGEARARGGLISRAVSAAGPGGGAGFPLWKVCRRRRPGRAPQKSGREGGGREGPRRGGGGRRQAAAREPRAVVAGGAAGGRRSRGAGAQPPPLPPLRVPAPPG